MPGEKNHLLQLRSPWAVEGQEPLGAAAIAGLSSPVVTMNAFSRGRYQRGVPTNGHKDLLTIFKTEVCPLRIE